MIRLLALFILLFSSLIHAQPKDEYIKLSLNVTGLPSSIMTKIIAGLSIKAAEEEPKLTRDRVELLAELSREEIIQRMESLGYYRTQVQYQLIPLSKTQLSAQYSVHTGAPTYINSVNIQITGDGITQPALQALIHHPPLLRGMQLEHEGYESFKEELLGTALQLGYLDATFMQSEIKINTDRSRADISLLLDTGRRYAFGSISFEDARYPSCYLERYVPFQPGEPYTTEQLSNLQTALWSSDLFTHVRVYPEADNVQNYSVPIQVRLKDKPLNTYTAGLGYGNETKFRGNLGWERRLTSFPGHQLNLNLGLSQKRNRASVLYTIPGLNPTAEQLILESTATEERFQGKLSKRWDNSATQILRFGNCEQVLGLHYLIEVFREDSNDPMRHSRFLFPTAGFVWKNLQKSCSFVHGFKIILSGKAAAKPLCSSSNLLQAEIEPKWIILLGEKARLIMRGDVGATYIQNPKLFPLSLRFFAGGEDSVRGYEYNYLGPKERNARGKNVVIGGRYLLVGSLEAEHVIKGDFSGAVFVDGGNAMNSFRTPIAVGAGFGVRWATPLGPFRLDIAHPVKRTKFRPQFYLSFGVDL